MGAKYSKLSKKEKKEISDEYGSMTSTSFYRFVLILTFSLSWNKVSISTIDEMMKNFSANCDANGAISKSGFCKLVSQSMSKELAERVFDSFDKDHNGYAFSSAKQVTSIAYQYNIFSEPFNVCSDW